MVERERVKEKERQILELLEKMGDQEKLLVTTESDLISIKQQYEDVKRQLLLNNRELENQIAVEQK